MEFILITASFTVEEIKEALWSCEGNKSLYPGEFNFILFKSCWEVVKSEVVNFITEFHSNAILPKHVSASFLDLRESSILSRVSPNFASVSLYKVLSKLLVGRINKKIGQCYLMRLECFSGRCSSN